MKFKPSSYTGGIIHHFAPSLVAYEHRRRGVQPEAVHTLIFINGLFGSLFSVGYVHNIAAALPEDWSLVEPELSSARLGFGVGSVSTDVAELSLLVSYLRTERPGGKVVLLGHSTGCQDALAYASFPISEKERKDFINTLPLGADGTSVTYSRPPVDAIVLQAAVSDRTALEATKALDSQREQAQNIAEQLVAEGRARDVLPRALTGAFGHAPISAARWLSLASPGPNHEGEDDMFSYDLPPQRIAKTFGNVGPGVRVLVLLCAADQYVPSYVNQSLLIGKWKRATETGGGLWDEGSGLLEKADHALEECGKEVLADFIQRLVGCLQRVVSV